MGQIPPVDLVGIFYYLGRLCLPEDFSEPKAGDFFRCDHVF